MYSAASFTGYCWRTLQANKIQNHRPYRHSLIQYIIKIKMFTGRLPFYVYHRDRFAKTSAAGIVTQHVPAAMIAMAATAVSDFLFESVVPNLIALN